MSDSKETDEKLMKLKLPHLQKIHISSEKQSSYDNSSIKYHLVGAESATDNGAGHHSIYSSSSIRVCDVRAILCADSRSRCLGINELK